MVKDKIIFVDSDGTVMDSMTLKHELCFGPALIETFNLKEYQEEILKKWNDINLYSLTRGINRFNGLGLILEYININFKKVDFLEDYKTWLNETKTKSNGSLLEYIKEGHKNLQAVIDWSNLTNKKIILHQDKVKPFAKVKECMLELSKEFKIIIISSANNKAVIHEWEKFGLLPLCDEICTQEMGTKDDCIRKMINKIRPSDAIMLGDAVGDMEAAKQNNISFYPINPRYENESWSCFLNVYSKNFKEGTYKQKEKDVINKFVTILKEGN